MRESAGFQPRSQRLNNSASRAGRSVWLMLAMFLAWCGWQKQAHAEPGRVELGAKLAPSLEKHAGERQFAENTYKQGISAGAVLRYGILDSLSLQAEILHATRGSNVESEGTSVGGFDFRYIEIPVLAHWRIPWLTVDRGRSSIAPYLIGGAAASFLLGAKDTDDGQSISSSSLNSRDVSFVVGLGVNWRISPRWATSLEVRFDRGFVDGFSTGVESKNQAFLLALGIDYALTGSGGDGDKDGDGVMDSADRCPTMREDRNGYRDSDGCPDNDEDEDQDGVLAGLDRCPGLPEDPDEFDDADGCPDEDNDGDRIPDDADECPNEAFPHNKALKHDKRGCRPRFVHVRAESDRLVLVPPLTFEVGKTVLNDEGKRTLDEVAELLTLYYPDMWLRLEGHADPATGGFNRNLALSSQRAEVVKDYLEGKGIRDRLSTKTVGAERPEYFDQRKNRRVDLVVVQKP